MRTRGVGIALYCAAAIAAGGCGLAEPASDLVPEGSGVVVAAPSATPFPRPARRDPALVCTGARCADPFNLRVVATTTDVVTVSWDLPTLPPANLVMLRDGDPLASLPGTATQFTDEGVEPGGLGPLVATASTQRDDAIEVSWLEPERRPGPQHTWQLVGRWSSGTYSSRPVTGRTAAPDVVGYEVSEDDGATWQSAGTRLSYLAQQAPPPRIDVSGLEPVVQPDDRRTVVMVALDGGINYTPVPLRFLARARTINVTTEPVAVVGHRGPDTPVTVRWQRSAADSDRDYADLPHVEGWLWFDPHPVLDEGRWYRPVLTFDDGTVLVLPGRRAVQWGAREVVSAAHRNAVLRRDGRVVFWPPQQVVFDGGTYERLASAGPMANRVCARRDGGIWDCVDGRTYPPAPSQEPLPQLVLGGETAWVGAYATWACGVQSDAGAACWADLPDGGSLALPVPGPAFTSLSVGDCYACGITAQQSVTCWQYCRGIDEPQLDLFPNVGAPAVLVSTARFATIGMAAGGAEFRAGGISSVPSFPFAGDETWFGTDGQTLACGIRPAGELRCVYGGAWCSAALGVLPARVESFGIGESHYCAVSQGTVSCGGLTLGGRVASVVAQTPFPEPVQALTIEQGRATALLLDGGVTSWGWLSYRGVDLGNDPQGVPYVDVAAPGPGSTVVCGLLADGRTRCVDHDPVRVAPTLPPGASKLIPSTWGTCALYPGVGIFCDGAVVLPGSFIDAKAGSGWARCGLTASGDIVCTLPSLSRTGDFSDLAVGVVSAPATTEVVCGRSRQRGWSCWPRALPVAPDAEQVVLRRGVCQLRRQFLECFTPDGVPFAIHGDPMGNPLPLRTRFRSVLISDAIPLARGCGIRTDGVVECFGAGGGLWEALPQP